MTDVYWKDLVSRVEQALNESGLTDAVIDWIDLWGPYLDDNSRVRASGGSPADIQITNGRLRID